MSEFWWGLIVFTLYIPLLFLWGFTLFDVFARHDLHGWQKALWVLAILFLPILGMLAYFIFRPHDAVDAYNQPYGAYSASSYYGYPGTVAPSTAAAGAPYNAYSGVMEKDQATELQMLDCLHESGTLSDDEFTKAKQKFAES